MRGVETTVDEVAKKNDLIQKYFDTVRLKDVLMEKIRQGQITLEEVGQLTKLNEEQYELVAEMINLQLIQIHVSEE